MLICICCRRRIRITKKKQHYFASTEMDEGRITGMGPSVYEAIVDLHAELYAYDFWNETLGE